MTNRPVAGKIALMPKLSGFADEIGPSLEEQIRVLRDTGVTHFELRTVGKVNVIDFTDAQRREHKRKIDDAGLGVACVGSPCGKQPADADDNKLMDQFKRARDAADFFGVTMIRVFSFYPNGGEGNGPVEAIRDRAIELLRMQCDLLDGTDIVMVHENEKGIYGDTGRRCSDLMKSVDSPKLRAAFDFANFVQVGDDPAKCWPMLKPFTAHIHVKDAKRGTGAVVPAGEGDGGVAAILADAYRSGYDGFFSLEPHLAVAGHSHGETGEKLWHVAVDALRKICGERDIPLAP